MFAKRINQLNPLRRLWLADQAMLLSTLVSILGVVLFLLNGQPWAVLVTAVLWLLVVIVWLEWRNSK